MTKQQLVNVLRNGTFADSNATDTVTKAVIYAKDLLGEDLNVIMAIGALLNTVADEIEKLEEV